VGLSEWAYRRTASLIHHQPQGRQVWMFIVSLDQPMPPPGRPCARTRRDLPARQVLRDLLLRAARSCGVPISALLSLRPAR